MPANYVADKTQTQAPSAKPEPQGVLTVALPTDGDPPNASTYIQGYKVLADFINWLFKPQGVTSLAKRYVHNWLTARGQTRFALDRHGLPAATVLVAQEYWPSIDSWVSNSTHKLTGSSGNYLYGLSADLVNETRGGVHMRDASISRYDHGHLEISPGLTSGHYAYVVGPKIARLHEGVDAVMEFSAALGQSTLPGAEAAVGFGTYSFTPGFFGAGLYFVVGPGTNNWSAVSSDGTNTTVVNLPTVSSYGSAYPPTEWKRFRIEFRSPGANDDFSTSVAHFFVNQNHVATITTTLPQVAASSSGFDSALGAIITARNTAVQSPASQSLWVGPIHLTCNLTPAPAAT